MVKKIAIMWVSLFLAFYFNTTFAACPQASPSSTPGFCSTFKLVAQCHCTSSGLPKGMCMNMHSLYDRMIAMFGSVRRACEYQRDTSVQNCIDSWNCYRSGGVNSNGELCSGTGSACE